MEPRRTRQTRQPSSGRRPCGRGYASACRRDDGSLDVVALQCTRHEAARLGRFDEGSERLRRRLATRRGQAHRLLDGQTTESLPTTLTARNVKSARTPRRSSPRPCDSGCAALYSCAEIERRLPRQRCPDRSRRQATSTQREMFNPLARRTGAGQSRQGPLHLGPFLMVTRCAPREIVLPVKWLPARRLMSLKRVVDLRGPIALSPLQAVALRPGRWARRGARPLGSRVDPGRRSRWPRCRHPSGSVEVGSQCPRQRACRWQ